MPFLRAYSPDLATHDINAEDFVAFIDNLAVAMIAPAPFQILDLGGMAAGFVPSGIAQLVSTGVGLASGVGKAAFIIARTKKYFTRVNKEFFNPRGLEVHMKKDGELCQILGLVGQMLQQVNHATYVFVTLMIAFKSHANRNINSVDNVITDMTPLPERRLRALQPYIANLTVDVPPPTKQTNIFDKIAAKQQEMNIAKQQRKNQKQAEKQIEKADKQTVKAEKRAHKDEKHRRQHVPTSGYQSSQQDYDEGLHSQRDDIEEDYSDTSSIASIEHKIMELDVETQRIQATANHGAGGSKDFAKVEKKLAKRSEDRMKLLRRLEKKKGKRKSKKRPESVGGQHGYEEQPDYGGQPARAIQSNQKQQEKEASDLERLRWIVVQNHQPSPSTSGQTHLLPSDRLN